MAADDIWILGIHMTKFGKHPDKDTIDLASEAAMGALADGGVTMRDMGVLAAGNLMGGGLGIGQAIQKQVGQTGTKITPELYLACGISGAIQHIAGCAGAKHIIAINTDPGAPILAHADYAVIGDLHQVIPALVSALRAR